VEARVTCVKCNVFLGKEVLTKEYSEVDLAGNTWSGEKLKELERLYVSAKLIEYAFESLQQKDVAQEATELALS